ncbi:MAG: hypothetical protein ACXU8U_13490, partial [Asticcacaulis sp.]
MEPIGNDIAGHRRPVIQWRSILCVLLVAVFALAGTARADDCIKITVNTPLGKLRTKSCPAQTKNADTAPPAPDSNTAGNTSNPEPEDHYASAAELPAGTPTFNVVGNLNVAISGAYPSGYAPQWRGTLNVQTIPVETQRFDGVTPIGDTDTIDATIGPVQGSDRVWFAFIFSAEGTRALVYSGDVSAPQGDAEDWVAFTPYAAGALLTLACT